MNKEKRLLIDASSIIWYSLLAGKDEEFSQVVEHNGKDVVVNGWQYGYENAVNSITNAWEKTGIAPKDTIFVWESGNSKGYRKQFLPTYKDGDTRAPQAYEQFGLLRDKLIEVIRSLGGVAVTRPHLEGDDVLAWLAGSLQGEKVIMTQDRDMAALLNEEIRLWRSAEYVDENPYGPFPCKLLPVYKALVGDTSDKIPGAKGFGEKAFLNMLAMFGEEGLEEVERMIVEDRLDELQANVQDLKVISKILENKDMVKASYKAGLLYPDNVENYRLPVQWLPGYCKDRSGIEDERLKPWAGTTILAHAGNFEKVLDRFSKVVTQCEYVALDIETSTPEESDDWLRDIKGGKGSDDDLGVDVLGSELTGMAITFGNNNQHTIYVTVAHNGSDGLTNVPKRDIVRLVSAIPNTTKLAIHNVAFELPVLYQELQPLGYEGDKGFLPNAYDTRIMASYVDENFSSGLKKLTKRWFDYDQTTYQEVTQGRKMCEMSASEVLSYGADDTIMTAALFNFFRIVMEAEGTLDAFEQVEIKPAYVTALAFVQGIKFSLAELRRIEEEDAATYKEHEKVLFEYLISKGWEGTVTPTFTSEDLEVPAKIKEIYSIVTGEELKTMVRTPSKIFKLIEVAEPAEASALAEMMESGRIAEINQWVAKKYDWSPKIDLSSTRQMQKLLYEVMELPPRLINSLTDKQRENKELANAIYKFNKIYRGSSKLEPLTDKEIELVKTKATTDRFAIEFALEFDKHTHQEVMPVLKSIQELSHIQTRQSLFYTPYPRFIHWKTGRVHPHVNQSATVTRRYTSSRFNVQQMSKKGDGVKVRGVIVPHKANAWIVSMDFDGQELRLGADRSQDRNMLACYIGDNLRDIHSIMASHPNMLRRWGEDLTTLAAKYGFTLEGASEDDLYSFFVHVRKKADCKEDGKLADDLRKLAKNVVFGTSYGAQAPTLAKQMTTKVEEAEDMLQAKKAMFQGYEDWLENCVKALHKVGYVTTYLGARRHLADGLKSENKWEVEKAERQGPNMEIQGSAAEQTKLVMAKIWDRGIFQKYDAQFIAPIHDEVVFSVSDKDLIQVCREVHECMVGKYLKVVPTLSSISIGKNFAKQEECGSHFDEQAIMKARSAVIGSKG